MPPSFGKRVESSTMMRAVGKKKPTAAITHRLRDEGPLWAAAAIQRGPSTAAMLKSTMSIMPISRLSWMGTVMEVSGMVQQITRKWLQLKDHAAMGRLFCNGTVLSTKHWNEGCSV